MGQTVVDEKPDFIIIGNPESCRIELFQEALLRSGCLPAKVISYISILSGEIDIQEIGNQDSIFRIESPGENIEVEKKLLELGGFDFSVGSYEHGRIYYPGLWFKGFKQLMQSLAKKIPAARWMNHPQDIVTMFDKPLCKKLLKHTIPSLPAFKCADDFFEFAQKKNYPRYFIKLNYSSSASGVTTYEYNNRTGQHQAISTIEVVETGDKPAFYNSLKIRKYRSISQIKTILDFLFSNGAFVEPWIPKDVHNCFSYDLRVVAIDGNCGHSIARLSRSPMTNLHLGNIRLPTDELDLDEDHWEKIKMVADDTMKSFPRSLYAGLDIIIPKHNREPVLLEVNAFGDQINNMMYQGKSTYEAEIDVIILKEAIAQ